MKAEVVMCDFRTPGSFGATATGCRKLADTVCTICDGDFCTEHITHGLTVSAAYATGGSVIVNESRGADICCRCGDLLIAPVETRGKLRVRMSALLAPVRGELVQATRAVFSEVALAAKPGG